MPRHKEPLTLESSALIALGNWIADRAEQQMIPMTKLSQKDTTKAQHALTEYIDIIKAYIQNNVPWMLHDKLTNETIKSIWDLLEKTKHSLGFRGCMGKFVSQMNVIIRMTEVIFNKNLTTLSIDAVPKMLRSIFYSKLPLLTGLVHLNLGSLSGGWKTADMEEAVIKSLKNLHSLKYLFINYDCTDNILRCVAENCTNLVKLDVSCSKYITNSSIDILAKLKDLQSVQLYRTFVTLDGFVNLLLKCKKLQDIGRCDEIGKVLEYINLYHPKSGPFQLVTYVSRYATNDHLQLAVQMCPHIRSMTIFHNTLQSDLMVLIGLGDLRELKLLSCDFYADQIKQVLQVKGCNITHLHLEHVDQIDLNALMYISQLCPLLECLTLYNCSLIQHTSLYTKKLDIAPFRNLKKITLVSMSTEEQLLFIFTNCLNAEFIHIGTAVQLTDDFLLKILDKNPLIYLKELRIMQSDFLTIRSIEKIIESCMSLEILVEIESWALLTDHDREYIRNYIKVNNYNIDISPIRRYDS